MIESYNFMKGNETMTAKELEDHWKEHGIERPVIRSLTSKFELLFAPLPGNSKLAVTDFTISALSSVIKDYSAARFSALPLTNLV